MCCQEGPLTQQNARVGAPDGLDRMGRGGGSLRGLYTQAEAWPFSLRVCGGWASFLAPSAAPGDTSGDILGR